MPTISRRDVLKGGAAILGAASLPASGQAAEQSAKVIRKGRVKQSACFWC